MHWRGTAPSSYSRSRKFRLRPSTNVVGRSVHSRHMFGPELVGPSKPRSLPKSPRLECASEFPYGSTPSHQRVEADKAYCFRSIHIRANSWTRAVVVQRCNGRNLRLARHMRGEDGFPRGKLRMIDGRQRKRQGPILGAGNSVKAKPQRHQIARKSRREVPIETLTASSVLYAHAASSATLCGDPSNSSSKSRTISWSKRAASGSVVSCAITR
ncbi:hypothetical protein ABIB81_003055 [Bradyrhizobium sp. I1.7.5]